MGFYIQTPGQNIDKADRLVQEYGAKIIPCPTSYDQILEDNYNKAYICVVSNGSFEAAAYCYDEEEFIEFTNPRDIRPKIWVVMDKKLAEELSGYNR